MTLLPSPLDRIRAIINQDSDLQPQIVSAESEQTPSTVPADSPQTPAQSGYFVCSPETWHGPCCVPEGNNILALNTEQSVGIDDRTGIEKEIEGVQVATAVPGLFLMLSTESDNQHIDTVPDSPGKCINPKGKCPVCLVKWENHSVSAEQSCREAINNGMIPAGNIDADHPTQEFIDLFKQLSDPAIYRELIKYELFLRSYYSKEIALLNDIDLKRKLADLQVTGTCYRILESVTVQEGAKRNIKPLKEAKEKSHLIQSKLLKPGAEVTEVKRKLTPEDKMIEKVMKLTGKSKEQVREMLKK